MFSLISVFHAIEDFIQGLHAHSDEKPSENTWSITHNINVTMGLLNDRPSEPETAKLLPALWNQLKGLECYSMKCSFFGSKLTLLKNVIQQNLLLICLVRYLYFMQSRILSRAYMLVRMKSLPKTLGRSLKISMLRWGY